MTNTTMRRLAEIPLLATAPDPSYIVGAEELRRAAVPQPGDGISHAPKIETSDAEVRWTEPAFAVDRRVRACTPAPGAWTTFRGERLGLGPVEPLPPTDLAPGRVAVAKHEVCVGTGSGTVRLGVVRPVGKKEIPAADCTRGVRIEDGEGLG